MQDDDKTPVASPDPDAAPSSHEHLNRPGMTNGVPDQAGDEQAIGGPNDDRQQTENAAADADGQAGGGSGS